VNAANAAALPVMLATRALPEMEAEQAALLARHRAAAGTAPLGAQYEAIGVRAPTPAHAQGLGRRGSSVLDGEGRPTAHAGVCVRRATCARGARSWAVGVADSGGSRCGGSSQPSNFALNAQVQVERFNALVDAATLHAADKPGSGPLDPKARGDAAPRRKPIEHCAAVEGAGGYRKW